MDGQKKLIIAAIVFVVLLGVALLVQEDPYEKPEKANLPTLPEIDPSTIDKVEIINQSEAITFTRQGDEKWRITAPEEYDANKNFEGMVLKKFEGVKIDRSVSEKKEKHADFEVDEKGTRVRLLTKGEEVFSAIIGKNTPDFKGTFIRLPDSDTVFVTTKVIGGGLKKSVSDWRNKQIFDFNADTITEVSVNTGEAQYTFKKTEAVPAEESGDAGTPPKWVLEGDDAFPVDEARLKSTLATLSRMQWSEIDETEGAIVEKGLDKEALAFFRFKTNDGKEHTIYFGDMAEDAQNAWIKLDSADNAYQIKKWQYSRLLKEQSYYKGDKEKPVK